MNILLYNWASVEGNAGGGVNVYIKNIIPGLLAKGHKVTFLNSGVTYTRDTKLRIEKLSDCYKGCQRYEIINSPVVAPAHSMFDNLEKAITSEELKSIFISFCKEKNFDIIHFNNIEGLSLDVLSAKKELASKFIYSIHNYHVVCPQVNLWKNEEQNCLKYNFHDCVNCVYPNNLDKEIENRICVNQSILIRGVRAFYRRKILKNSIVQKIRKTISEKDKTNNTKNSLSHRLYKDYIDASISAINENIDFLISVSQRTHDVVCKRGIRKDRHDVIYIGTKVAEKADRYPKEKDYQDDNILTIAYLGYMRHDKGFYYLLWLLENLPEFILRHINFTLAARLSDARTAERLKKLKSKLYGMAYYNGYTHDTLEEILENVDLGIVPVLWEDCLPQVAIEFVCHGIPILSSDLGGAQELGSNENFVYIAKDKEDFIEKLAPFIYNKNNLNSFWKNFKPCKKIDEHVMELEEVYSRILAN